VPVGCWATNYVDLFGADHAVGAVQLVATITKALGGEVPSQATLLVAVEELAAKDRPAALRRMTKDLLLDPAQRIQLDDVVSDEAGRVLAAMRDETRFPTQNLAGSTQDEQLVSLVTLATSYWRLVEPFCWSLQVAARFAADTAALTPWTIALRSVCAEAARPKGGNTALLKLQYVPGLAATFTAALACVGQARWDNLKTLLIDTTAPASPYSSQTSVPLVAAVHPWQAFGSELAPHVLARTALTDEDPAAALAGLLNRQFGKYHTPIAEWLHVVLRPIFAEQFRDDADYSHAFDRTEVILGLLSQDQDATVAAQNPDRSWARGSTWFGRSTYRAARGSSNALQEIQDELKGHALTWGPLQAGLFGGVYQRAEQASDSYAEAFNDRTWRS